jgi:ribosomal protein S27AE
MTDEKDRVGICAPQCPRCGWQAVDRPDDDAGRQAAKAEVVAHKRECPTPVARPTFSPELP